MEWCRLYARLRHDTEVQNLSDSAFRLFVESLCYATEAETDGHVPRVQLPKFGRPGTNRNAAALVAARLWSDVGDGWVITKWQTLQEDLETVRKRRKKDAERKAQARAERNGVRGGLHQGLHMGVLPVEEIEERTPLTPGKPGEPSCAKHPDEPHPNCRGCGTNTRAVRKAAKLAAVPSWCGDCESTDRRMVELDDGRVARCPRCHPSTVRSA